MGVATRGGPDGAEHPFGVIDVDVADDREPQEGHGLLAVDQRYDRRAPFRGEPGAARRRDSSKERRWRAGCNEASMMNKQRMLKISIFSRTSPYGGTTRIIIRFMSADKPELLP